MPREKRKNEDAKAGQDHTKPLTWGLFFILIGFIFIILALLIEANYHPSAAGEIGLKLVEHLGIAAIVLGLVGIIVEFNDWQEYFQKRLADIVIDRKYLNTLEKEKLLDLQTDTLKAYFKDEEIDRTESFLDFFQTKIQDFIGSPYKEDTRHIISVDLSDDRQSYVIEETISARNRKVRDSIPDRAEWMTYKDTYIKLLEFSITVEIPRNFYQSPDFESRYPDMGSERKIYETEFKEGELIAKSPELQPAKEGQGFTLLLNDYQDVDGLYVETSLKYTLPVNLPLSWQASHAHKGLSLVITYPPNLEIDVTIFGIDESDYHETSRTGLYTFEYGSWLLPHSGYSYHFRQ